MFIILVNYLKPIEDVERALEAHREFLAKHYAAGNLLLSGPQNPRTGGVIMARAARREAVERLVSQDPFFKEGIAEYEIMEFLPTMTAEGLEALKEA
ncbi:GTP cyclohydrolase [Pseudodesulfovibrio cashew]|uniref:GTP cyclohydrolase n=1 Tax=Pseudodesulfovibrio cashew TaxID=2678688 RepID=A0A6I6J7L9_9BACT|nr:YciI family protein [Pseudodesulfovibrio cashew]QGY38816.1 GTP cyclohydrolase [Pseudodesulfovibrio cashew]